MLKRHTMKESISEALVHFSKDICFFDSISSICQNSSYQASHLFLTRAFETMSLDGVLFVKTAPMIYFKEFKNKLSSADERVELQRKSWNQGIVPILMVIDSSAVYIYSSLAKPVPAGRNEGKICIETFTATELQERFTPLLTAILSGKYFKENISKFSAKETVDAFLLKNIGALRDALCQKNDAPLEDKQAHFFLGRLLFCCYLLDRKIISIQQKRKKYQGAKGLRTFIEQTNEAQRSTAIYAWFSKLKLDFNGTMFDADLVAEQKKITAQHIEFVLDFLNGDEAGTLQKGLGFWLYDFNIIPVETISAIYECFFAKENAQDKRDQGAFYTPRFLAGMLIDNAFEDDSLMEKRCLDPACGSGIFLVSLFSRMISQWLQNNPQADYSQKVDGFQGILRNNIKGIDNNETACRISCFSLYLAYLDSLDPKDIRQHVERTGHALPKLLTYDFQNDEANLIPVVCCKDTLSSFSTLDNSIDFVVGNPPWEERTGKLAQQFMKRVIYFLSDTGKAVLLLSTKVLLNENSNKFQEDWLQTVKINSVVQLADFSFLLFEHAQSPTVVVDFSRENELDSDHHFLHTAPKFNLDTLQSGDITSSYYDKSYVRQNDFFLAAKANKAPVLWKRILWGTTRDLKLLALLDTFPKLADNVAELSKERKSKKRWAIGQGFKPWKNQKSLDSEEKIKPQAMPWSMEHKFLDARDWQSDLLVIDQDTISLVERLTRTDNRLDFIYSNPDNRLFQPPMILVSQGSANIKCAYNDNIPLLFQHALQSIFILHASEFDRQLLKCLCAYLRSSLGKYYLFHSSANWGTERDKVHLHELLQIPFPLPEDTDEPEKAKGIMQQIDGLFDDLHYSIMQHTNEDLLSTALPITIEQRKSLVDKCQAKLNTLIYQYFGLTEQEIAIVEDTCNIIIPSTTPGSWQKKIKTLDSLAETTVPGYDSKGLEVYAKTLCNLLNTWATKYSYSWRAIVGSHIIFNHEGIARVSIWRADAKVTTKHILTTHITSDFLNNREIIEYTKDSLTITRPDKLICWTRIAAINDAARFLAEVRERWQK